MLFDLLLSLFKAKAGWIAAAKIPLIAALLAVSSTGFVVTGTVSGDENDEDFVLTVKPLETRKCVTALVAQTEALLELDVIGRDALQDLRRARERARESGEDLNKKLDEPALLTRYNTFATQIRDALAQARQDVLRAAELQRCSDGSSETSVDVDIADLRGRYDRIVRDLGQKVNKSLTDGQVSFDQVVASSPDEPQAQQNDDQTADTNDDTADNDTADRDDDTADDDDDTEDDDD